MLDSVLQFKSIDLQSDPLDGQILWVDTSMTNWKFIRHMDMCRKLEWSKD